MSNSRWANASREELEALAEACQNGCVSTQSVDLAMNRLRASCPPLRTEAEVAAERLRNLDAYMAGDINMLEFRERDRALAKEPTR